MYSLPVKQVILGTDNDKTTYWFDVEDIVLLTVRKDTFQELWWVDVHLGNTVIYEAFESLEAAEYKAEGYLSSKYQGSLANARNYIGYSAERLMADRRTEHEVSEERSVDSVRRVNVPTDNDGGTTE